MQRPYLISRIVLSSLAAMTVTWPVVAADDIQPAKQSAAVTPEPRTAAWWVERHQNANARGKEGNIDLIWIGDSITQGWEGAGAEVWNRFYGTRRPANLGFSGDQTQHVLWRLEHGNLEGITPKVAVIMIGTNNSNGDDFSAAEITEGVKTIVKSVRTKLPKTRVLLLGIFPRGEYPNAQREKIINVNNAIAQMADSSTVRYVDIGDAFLQEDGRISREIMPDFLHLSPKGYEIWAKAIEPVLAEMLGEKSESS
jgi:beta-glucosidase